MNCNFCNSVLPNNKAVHYRCKNCSTVWCNNGNCTGSSGKRQTGRTPGALCQSCMKAGGIEKV